VFNLLHRYGETRAGANNQQQGSTTSWAWRYGSEGLTNALRWGIMVFCFLVIISFFFFDEQFGNGDEAWAGAEADGEQ